MKLWKKLALALLAAAAALAGVFVWKVGPRNAYGLVRYGTQRREGDLKIGHRAPDVALVSLDGKTRVRLAESTGGRPLVLVFGSYT